MKTLHIQLILTTSGNAIAGDSVELRYFYDNPNDYQYRQLQLNDIADLILEAECYYYTTIPDFVGTGRRLYDWLDGSDRWLTSAIASSRREGLILAISTPPEADFVGFSDKVNTSAVTATESQPLPSLVHLPWEVLHDGQGFLVERIDPYVVPVRWLPDSGVTEGSLKGEEPADRQLQVLFMATSPDGTNVLDYEREEARILEATARQPLTLVVEESGCLEELSELVRTREQGYFDVFHLTGHGTIRDDGARFVTETEIGDPFYASARDIAVSFPFRFPKLFFLSGCRTGEAGNGGMMKSLAQEMLELGARAVLSWGHSVLDTDATEAAAALYKGLASGFEVAQAVALTYQSLIKNRARDWHLLRLYVAGEMPSALVTVPGRRRSRVQPPPTLNRALDPEGTKLVAAAADFVGRRRAIQNCLRSLKYSPDEVGVLLYGMGGLGKSTLAKRLSDRISDYQLVVWIGKIDEPSLVYRLSRYFDPALVEILQDPKQPLDWRLRRVLSEENMTGKPLLFVLDDFEQNLDSRGKGFVMKPAAVQVLSALVSTLWEWEMPHRMIVTCRYEFDSPHLQRFYKQPLDGLPDADLRKKCDRLKSFNPTSTVEQQLREQAITLADRNPRLLEELDKVLQNPSLPRQEILDALAKKPRKLREKVLAETLLAQIDKPMRQLLCCGLAFELPVPREALSEIGRQIDRIESQIDRAIALGLLEVSPDGSLRVPRILPLKLPENATPFYRKAAKILYRLWWQEADSSTEEQRREIHRVALRGNVGEIAAEIGTSLAIRWNKTSRWREAAGLCRDTLAIVEDYRILHSLAFSEQYLGEVESAEAHYQQAFRLCPEEDIKEKAAIIHNLAILKANRGQIEEAIADYQQSLELERSINGVQGIAATLHCLAILKADRGQIDEAIADYQQSLELKRSINDVQGIAATLHCLAILKADRGQIEEAIADYQQSLELKRSINDVQGIAATLHCLAILKADRGQIEEAIADYQQSLELKRSINNVQGIAATLHQLAGIKADRGQIEEAIADYQQSLELQRSINNVQGIAATLHQLAILKADRGQIEEAIADYQQSLELQRSINNVQGIAATLHQLAGIKADRGQIDEAIADYQQSLELDRSINNVQGIAATLAMLGQLLVQHRGDFATALSYLQESLTILQRLGSPHAATVEDILAWVRQMSQE